MEEYTSDQTLTLTHLRELAPKSEVQDTGWLMSVQVTDRAPTCPSDHGHTQPRLTVKETELAEQNIQTERLYVESLNKSVTVIKI